MAKIRMLIADDHAILRDGITALFDRCDDIDVVGEATDGSEAIRLVEKLRPDVTLIDIAMPGLGGLEATLEIAEKTKVIVLTQYDSKEYVYRFFRAGAVGYILKRAMGNELVSAVRAVARGETYVDPSIATEVVEGFLRGKVGGDIVDPYDRLSDREKQVLKLLAEGMTARVIGETLHISAKTVVAHRANIMAKLAIHNRTALIKFAIAKGVI